MSKPPFFARFTILVFVIVAAVAFGPAQRAEGQTPEADVRWQQIKALQQKLSGDAPKGANEIEYFAPVKAQLHQEAADFASEYERDPRRWEAQLIELKTDVFPIPAPERKAIFLRHEQIVSGIAAAPDAPAEIKENAERTILFQHLDHLDLVATPPEAAILENRIETFLQNYPGDPKAASLQVRRLDVLAKSEPAKVRPLLDSLAASDRPAVAVPARGRLARLASADAPLDWKFTALDGSAVDLAQVKGRVILIDFWASWCPDCLRALPQVLAVYHKYHDKGFEVIGVSLDSDQEALQSFLKKHGIPWPQHFDGKGWDTDLAVHYGVRGIPDMWLVGKDGRIVATGVETDEIDTKVARLLEN